MTTSRPERYRFFMNGSELRVLNAIAATNHSSVPSRIPSSMISPTHGLGNLKLVSAQGSQTGQRSRSGRDCRPLALLQQVDAPPPPRLPWPAQTSAFGGGLIEDSFFVASVDWPVGVSAAPSPARRRCVLLVKTLG